MLESKSNAAMLHAAYNQNVEYDVVKPAVERIWRLPIPTRIIGGRAETAAAIQHGI